MKYDMIEIGFYCPECNKVHVSCWEINGNYMCSTCFNEKNVKTITAENIKCYLKKCDFKNDALNIFENYKLDCILTEKEINMIRIALNMKLRREKLEKIQEIIDGQ